jgi:hypothetical protein
LHLEVRRLWRVAVQFVAVPFVAVQFVAEQLVALDAPSLLIRRHCWRIC